MISLCNTKLLRMLRRPSLFRIICIQLAGHRVCAGNCPTPPGGQRSAYCPQPRCRGVHPFFQMQFAPDGFWCARTRPHTSPTAARPAATTRTCTVAERAAAQRRSYSSPATGRLHNNFQSECSAMNNWHSTLANFALALRAEFAALDFEQVCMAVT